MSNKILIVETSPRGIDSVTRKVTKKVEKKLKETYSNAEFIYRDVAAIQVPHLELNTISAFFTPQEKQDENLKKAVELSDQLIEEVLKSDIIVIGIPVWNFHIPSSLKAWIDHIVRVGKTFLYSKNGPVGLTSGKKTILVIAGGGTYSSGSSDFIEPYLKYILKFIGITDVQVVRVEGLSMSHLKDMAIQNSEKNIEGLML